MRKVSETTEFERLVGRIIRQCVREGEHVTLDGLGTFVPAEVGAEPGDDNRDALRFIADCAPRVFVAYASEDSEAALNLVESLRKAGFNPWIDKQRLMPGQHWRPAIARAIERSDFFIACLSTTSIRKRGQFPHEIRLALHGAHRMPLDDSFILPVRIDDCSVPRRIQSSIQYVDLFPDWEEGIAHVVDSIWHEFGARLQRG